MASIAETERTLGLRVLPGGTDLAARVALDYEQKLFRRNYRRPVLVSAALSADCADVKRWLDDGAARWLGYDVAARALNRVACEAAEPLFLHAIISGPAAAALAQVRQGVADACVTADCAFVDFSPSECCDDRLAIHVSATGVVELSRMMDRRRFEKGDAVLAIGSNRLWPAMLPAARAIIAARSPAEVAAALDRSPSAAPDRSRAFDFSAPGAFTQPVPALAGQLHTMLHHYTVKRVVHAMTPVEGDGLSASVARLMGGAKFEIKRGRSLRRFSPLLDLLAEHGLTDESFDEGHRLGLALLMVASSAYADAIVHRLRLLGATVHRFGKLQPTAEAGNERTTSDADASKTDATPPARGGATAAPNETGGL